MFLTVHFLSFDPVTELSTTSHVSLPFFELLTGDAARFDTVADTKTNTQTSSVLELVFE